MPEDMAVQKLLAAFKRQRLHMAIVLDEFGGMEGVISIEDILEEIIGTEIVDEFDQHADMRAVAEKRARDRKIIE